MMTTKRTGYPVIDELLETIAPHVPQNEYQTRKHGFQPLPNNSVVCRWCKRSFTDDLHCNVEDDPNHIRHEAEQGEAECLNQSQ